MARFALYPRGFTTRSEGEGVVKSSGDASVQTLYELLDQRNFRTDTWKFRKMVIDCALRLFGDFATWLKDQQRNPNLVGYSQEFLKDTLTFVHGGDRLMSVVSWTDLLAEAGLQGKAIPVSALNPTQSELGRGETTIQIIQAWVARPNGTEDMLQTLYLLFGQSRRTAN